MAGKDTETKTSKPLSEVRGRLAQVVEAAFTVVAGLLVLAAVLIAFRGNINAGNDLVKLILNIAETFDGPLSRMDGIFDFDGKHATTQNALANWGLAALIYLVVGRVLGKVIRP